MFFCITVNAKDIHSITIYELLANSDRYAGKKVDPMGYYKSSFEHSVIYPSKEEARINNYLSGIWLHGSDLIELNDKYIQVIGIFDPTQKGHMGMFRGTINVEKIRRKVQ
jgi:hypothetical protein